MAPAINPRTVCRCQPIFSMILARVAPPLCCSIATTCAVLVPARGVPASRPWAAFLPLGACLAGVAFFPDLPRAGALWAACAPRLTFRCAGDFAGDSDFGATLSPSRWMRAQIRFTAVLLSLNLHRRYTRKAVPNRYRPLGRPGGGQLPEFLLAGEAVEWSSGGGGRLFGSSKRHDFVLFVDRKCRHPLLPFFVRAQAARAHESLLSV